VNRGSIPRSCKQANPSNRSHRRPDPAPSTLAPHCPHCQHVLALAVTRQGGTVTCPSCTTGQPRVFTLTPDEACAILDTILGQTDTPTDLDALLRMVAASPLPEDGGGNELPPSPFLYDQLRERRALLHLDDPPARPLAEAAPSPRQYAYRTPAVAAEVAALPAPGDPAFLPYVRAAQEPETVVRAIRRLVAAGDPATARQAGEVLYALITPRLGVIARHYFPYQPTPAADLAGELSLQVWRAIRDLRPAHDFWAFNFWCAVNRDASGLAAHLHRWVRAEVPALPNDADHPDAPLPDPATTLYAAELLAALRPQERIVAVLLAQGHSTVTIAARLGVTDRTVRNIRRRAAARLAAAGWATTSAGEKSPAPTPLFGRLSTILGRRPARILEQAVA
jgi:RNA polymerase sigma factor (sigma-70 family)